MKEGIIMSFFKKKEQKPISFDKDPMNFRELNRTDDVRYSIPPTQIMVNDGVNICAEACACCWDTKLPDGYEKRSEYITKRTKIGHGSVTEHSNHVFFLTIGDSEFEDLCNILANCKYLNTCWKHSRISPVSYLIIGGSWRAYDDLIKRMSKPEMADNSIFRNLLGSIYKNINKAGLADVVEEGIIDDNFDNPVFDTIYSKVSHRKIGDLIEVINCDDLDKLIENLQYSCPESDLFTPYDLLDFCTITVLFKNMSRIITQQLTRHRNGITQESQRYVNYKDSGFNSPALFKDKYDPNYQYSIQFGRSSQKMTLQEIGVAINSLYGQLIDAKRTNGHNLQLEDARGYLANNTQCGKIYMTFTWRTFFKFLELREDLHAQVEIRNYAKVLGAWFRELYPEYSNVYDALIPKSINNTKWCNSIGTYTNIDEVNEVLSEEEIIQKMEDQIAYEAKSEDNNND